MRADAHDPITTKVTWSKEIVRILNGHCVGCHQPGGAGPMSLATYENAKPWAKAIRDETMARRMPKWPAARGFGAFANDRSLSPFEIALVAAWADGGAPKGDVRDLPAAVRPAPTAGDALVLPRRQTAPAGEQRSVTVRTSWSGPRWIRGWQFISNDPAIVQAEFRINGEYLGNWVPPEESISLPDDAGVPVTAPASATVTVTTWYRSARMQEDFPVGLPKKAPELRVTTGTVPPERVIRQAEVPCGNDAGIAGVVFAVRPVADAPAASIAVTGRPLDAPPRPLLWARELTPTYEPTYRLLDPLTLPAGSRLDVRGDAPGCRVWVAYLTSTTKGVVSTRSPR